MPARQTIPVTHSALLSHAHHQDSLAYNTPDRIHSDLLEAHEAGPDPASEQIVIQDFGVSLSTLRARQRLCIKINIQPELVPRLRLRSANGTDPC